MNKNSLLNIANFFCQLFQFIFGISIVLITIVFIHFQVDRNFYDQWKFEKPNTNSTIFIETQSSAGEKTLNGEKMNLSDWSTGSLYFNYLKFTSILIFLYLSINQFIYVLKSVKELETFHQTNVTAFMKIGKYCLIISGLSIFSYWEFSDYSISSFSISFDILIIALIAFILAEVFREGNSLMEENQLTV